jgi:hypothetical protein
VAFPGQGRHAVQQAVTDAVWAELERYLRELRRV